MFKNIIEFFKNLFNIDKGLTEEALEQYIQTIKPNTVQQVCSILANPNISNKFRFLISSIAATEIPNQVQINLIGGKTIFVMLTGV